MDKERLLTRAKQFERWGRYDAAEKIRALAEEAHTAQFGPETVH